MNTQKIGEFLKILRRERKWTQEELGEKIGVTNKTISKWENGNYMPPIDVLLMLSEMYGVTINELIKGQRFESA